MRIAGPGILAADQLSFSSIDDILFLEGLSRLST
jgi:hypothetical protein